MMAVKPRIIFLLNSIDINKGGLTHASLRQASTFADAGYETHLLTFTYNQRFRSICDYLVKMGKVNKKVNIRNMFEEYSGYTNKDKINIKTVDPFDVPSKSYSVSQRKGHNAFRYFNNGVYEKYVSLTEDNILDFIDYFNISRYRTKRVYYNLFGDIDRVKYFNYENNKVQQEFFYDKFQKVFLTIWYKAKSGEKTRIIHFDSKHNIISETIGDEIPYKLHWLNQVLNEKDAKTILISDTRSTDRLLVHLDHKCAKTIIRPHSNHLKNAEDPTSDLNDRNKYAIENIKNVDALVVLTEKQRQDIIKRFGYEDKIFAIPNYYETPSRKITGLRSLVSNIENITQINRSRDTTKVVIVSRFSTIKNIDHVIHAFKKVVEQVPQATLEIWGQGDEESSYKTLIEDYYLKKNIKIKGYAKHPEKKYQSSALSVVTSKAEGFSLSVMESMVNSTPVISYDLRYGPSDMIEDGINGFLIPQNDIDALADKIIYMLQYPRKAREMGKAARKTMNTQFNKKNYQNIWFSLVNQLLTKGS